MPKINSLILDDQLIDFYSYNEIMYDSPPDMHPEALRFFREHFRDIKKLSDKLKVPCPYLGLAPQLHLKHPDGSVSVQDARYYTSKNIRTIDNSLLILSAEAYDPEKIVGILAHEMRHIWQETHLAIDQDPAAGFIESLTHPAEIDADGYAIWYLASEQRLTLEAAAAILCPEEKMSHAAAYDLRLSCAKKLKKEHAFWGKIINWLC